jgi:hypothetical protein
MVGMSAAQDVLFDFDALERPRDATAIAVYKRAAGADAVNEMKIGDGDVAGATLTYGMVAVFAVLVPAGIPLFTGVLVLSFPDGSGFVSGLICIAVAIAVGAALALTVGRRQYRKIEREWALRGSWSRRWRFSNFARDNGFRYRPRPVGVPHVGSLLRAIQAEYYDMFSSRVGGRAAEFVNARSNTQLIQAPSAWGVISIALDRAVPPLLLAPKGGGAPASATRDAIGKRRRLSLEGDFDRHFTLYAPPDAEREALYVITPDLMALLIDHLPGAHVETIAATLVVTTPRPLRFDRRQTWADIGSILDLVGAKTARQTQRLAPERSPLAGRTIQRGSPWRQRAWIIGTLVGISLIALNSIVHIVVGR